MKIELKKISGQFFKFGAVGALNTVIDLAVLNSLIFIFGLSTDGHNYFLFKSISFVAAVLNSYIFNKYWVFKMDKNKQNMLNLKGELGIFFIVSIVGFIFNTSVSYFIFSAGNFLLPSITNYVWANVGAIVGTMVVLLWNFLGYKFFVFKR